MAGSPLKIGVMLDSFTVPAWTAKTLADIARADFLTLSIAILNAEKRDRDSTERLLQARSRLLFVFYEKVDQWLFSWRHSDAFAPTDISEHLSGAKIVTVLTSKDESRQRFHAADVAMIKDQDLDVILKLGFNELAGEILSSTRYGIWSLNHADDRQYRGDPPHFWEIYEENPLSGSSLQILTEEPDHGKVIYRSQSSTHPYSLFRNRNQIYWKSATFMMRRLKNLCGDGWNYITSLETYNEEVTYAKTVYQVPKNRQMIYYLANVALRFARAHHDVLCYNEQWRIAFRKLRIADLDSIDLTSAGFTIVTPPDSSSFADPFIVKENGINYIFFEEYSFRRRKGAISYITVDDEGNVSASKIALQRDYHLSYPMLFQWRDSYYMIPETRQNGTIELYHAVKFPTRWELEKVLFHDVQAVDPTLFQHAGKFWLFTNMSVSGGSTVDELFLFYSESPLGKWLPHPKNPIVSDVRRARPAGRLFWLNGSLYRPSQEGSIRYGHAVNLNRVDVLSENEYLETPVKLLTPDWLDGNLKTHTFNFNEDLAVVDAMIMVKKPIQSE
jgi:hypothetical protein